MIFVRLGIFVFLLPSLLGFLLWELAQARGRRNHWESLAFAFPIGWGAVSTLMLLLATFGVRLAWILIASLVFLGCILAWMGIAYLTKTGMPPKESAPAADSNIKGRNWIWWTFLGVIVLELCLVAVPLVKNPIISDWDGWAIWGFKAKAFFVDRGFSGYLSRAIDYGFSWPARPCSSSIFQAYLYMVGGQVLEGASRFAHLASFISLLLIFYCTLRRRLHAPTAMAWTAMLATVPNLTDQATAGLGNILLAIFLFSAISAVDRWRAEGTGGYLVASSAFLGFALLTRDEASGLCAICAAFALLFAPRPDFTSRGRMLLQTIAVIAGAAAIYSLWLRMVKPFPVFDLRSVWLTPDLLPRAFQHIRDLGGVLGMIGGELAQPSEQALASPLEKWLGLSLFWVIFGVVFVLSAIRAILHRYETPILRQNELATKCGICTVLGIVAYSAGLWLFPYTSLNDLDFWCNVLDRHILSLVPLAACHIALSLSPQTGPREPQGAMIGTGEPS